MFFRYVLGSLLARKMSNVVAVLSIGLVIGACVVSLAFYHGLKDNMAATGRPDNLVVVEGGVLQTTKSFLSKQAIDLIGVLPQVAQEDGQPLVSPEAHLEVDMGESTESAPVRGIDPIAFRVHDQVKILEGRAPEKGSNEIILGRKLVGKVPEWVLGGSVQVNNETWPVVGVFSAAGSALEGELWGDRVRLGIALKRPTLLCAVLRVRTREEAVPLAAAIAKLRLDKGTASAISEVEYFETTLGNIGAVTKTVAALISVLVLGAVFAAANTLHASLSSRMGEFAALWVVGHKRRRLVRLILQEAFLLCVAAACVASALAATVGGAEVKALLGGEIEFKLPFGLIEVGSAFALAAAIGFVGTLYPSIQLLKRDLSNDLG